MNREDLEKEGWERQFTTDESRVDEFVELYESLGFEVYVEVPESENEGCNICFEGGEGRYRTIYIRRRV